MAPTRKGLYSFCIDCKYKIRELDYVSTAYLRYPCEYSHKAIRGKVKYERDFKECLKYERKEDDVR